MTYPFRDHRTVAEIDAGVPVSCFSRPISDYDRAMILFDHFNARLTENLTRAKTERPAK